MKTVIDTDALVSNFTVLKRTVGELYCVVKCNAYGHGAITCANALYKAGARRFAVFSLAEALEIAPHTAGSEILIFGRTGIEDLSAVRDNGFIQTVFSEEYAEQIKTVGHGLKLHVKIDTGMNRSGFSPDALRIFSSLAALKNDVVGAYTHFPCADGDDARDTETRLSVFLKACFKLEDLLNRRLTKHSAASAAALRYPKARLDACRVGLALYGITPDNTEMHLLKPVMSFYGSIIGIRQVKKGETVGYGCRFVCKKDCMIATVDVGYAGGLQRRLCGRFMPSVLGERVPIAAICMDRSMLDVTSLFEHGKNVKAGDVVTFFGSDPKVTEMSDAADTISYEILTSMNSQRR